MIESRLLLIHLLDATKYKNAPIPSAINEAPIAVTYTITMNCSVMAIKYPHGLFQSNGNLLQIAMEHLNSAHGV